MVTFLTFASLRQPPPMILCSQIARTLLMLTFSWDPPPLQVRRLIAKRLLADVDDEMSAAMGLQVVVKRSQTEL